MTTTDRLRFDIDSGRTGDKVAAPDPAAAPLGTDEEAAGTPPSREAIELTRRKEIIRPAEHQKGAGAALAYIGILVIITAVAGGLLYFVGVL